MILNSNGVTLEVMVILAREIGINNQVIDPPCNIISWYYLTIRITDYNSPISR